MNTSIETLHFKTDSLEFGFEIEAINNFPTINNYTHKEYPHIIDFYAILFITEGKGVHEIDFKPYPFEENTVTFISKGQEHRWVDYKTVKGYIILFTAFFFRKTRGSSNNYVFGSNLSTKMLVFFLQKKGFNLTPNSTLSHTG